MSIILTIAGYPEGKCFTINNWTQFNVMYARRSTHNDVIEINQLELLCARGSNSCFRKQRNPCNRTNSTLRYFCYFIAVAQPLPHNLNWKFSTVMPVSTFVWNYFLETFSWKPSSLQCICKVPLERFHNSVTTTSSCLKIQLIVISQN